MGTLYLLASTAGAASVRRLASNAPLPLPCRLHGPIQIREEAVGRIMHRSYEDKMEFSGCRAVRRPAPPGTVRRCALRDPEERPQTSPPPLLQRSRSSFKEGVEYVARHGEIDMAAVAAARPS